MVQKCPCGSVEQFLKTEYLPSANILHELARDADCEELLKRLRLLRDREQKRWMKKIKKLKHPPTYH